MRRLREAGAATTALAVMGSMGCSTVRLTDPPRTATEQFLLSRAAVEAVDKLNFETLRGRSAWIEEKYFAASEVQFVLGQMRAKMLLQGVRLVPDRSEAEVVVEVRSGGVGIDRYGFLLGAPASLYPASAVTGAGGDAAVPILLPELSLLKNVDQRSVADVAYVAYWRETGEVVAASGPYTGRAFRDDWWYFGVGPFSRGDIAPVRRELEMEQASPAPGSSSLPEGSGAGEAGGGT